MNVTLYAWAEADSLRPGAIILDVPKYDDEHPEIEKVPTAYVVDEISDRLDGRTIYGLPIHRKDGKRRVWRFLAGEQVCVEPDEHTAAVLLRQISERAGQSSCVAVLGPGARSLAAIQAETSDPDLEPADEKDETDG